ncbi:MAG: hypothetical protein WBQ25_17265 [Nitrososphaeraceae archaeon]
MIERWHSPHRSYNKLVATSKHLHFKKVDEDMIFVAIIRIGISMWMIHRNPKQYSYSIKAGCDG